MNQPDAPQGLSLPVLGDSGAPLSALAELFGGLGARAGLKPLDDLPGSAEATAALEHVLHGLRRYRVGALPLVFSLQGAPAEALKRLEETVGDGEVFVTVKGTGTWEIRETGLPGLWRVRGAGGDYLEVADVPSVVRAANEAATCRELSIGTPPKDAMNVLPVLAELRHRMQQPLVKGQPNHVVSFTLLPMTEADMRYLEQRLQHGPVLAESKGYGSCRVELTGHRNLWSVQFFNAAGALILDTLEVGDVPVALCAADEDLQDSAQRLAELLGA